jgi:UDP-N-acetylmuramyl pentapeptide phosphotransferase/UDP-N-acetylglucosamine-1-phosphate transferase
MIGAPAAAGLALLGSSLAVAFLLAFRAGLPAAAPNARSLHARPVPRVGGLALWAGFAAGAAGVAAELPGGLAGWLPALVALVLVSLWDDARGAPVVVRLAVHAAAGLWAATWLLRMPGSALPGVAPGALYPVAVAGLALVLAWSANLYNFMDGSDGLAGAMALVGFGALSVAAPGDPALRIGALSLAVAAVPFLVVNRPPARMFLGDVGAVPAGFMAALLGVAGVLRGDWAAWFPVLVFLPFVADASATLARRAFAGERPWEAHRDHYYQRFHQLGAGHGGTLAAHVAVMVATSATALACRALAPGAGTVALCAWCAGYAVAFAAIDYHWRRRPTATR